MSRESIYVGTTAFVSFEINYQLLNKQTINLLIIWNFISSVPSQSCESNK